MITPANLLEVHNLRYAYGDRLAVQGISFQIRRGEILGFLGPNGAGKTTSICCVAGLLERWQGDMLWDGQPLPNPRPVQLQKRLGLVPQELAVYEELTGKENLAFFGRLNGLSGNSLASGIEYALELSGLADRANDRVKTFSGGMKRRLNLAIGELHQPQLLMLDEPTVGVDPQSRNHIFETLEKLRAAGRTLLYTTHYMEEAQRLCDRIAIMHEGHLAAIGTTAELADTAGISGANLEQVFLKLTGRSLKDD